MLLSLSEAEAQVGPSQPVINCNADASVCGALAPLGTTTANQGTAGSSPWLSFITNFPVGFNVNNFPTTYSVTGSINEMGLSSNYAPVLNPGQYAPFSLTILGALRTDSAIEDSYLAFLHNDLGVILHTDLASLNTEGVTTQGILYLVKSDLDSLIFSGAPDLGLVNANAPFPDLGRYAALSLTPRGDLRVDGSGVIQPISGTITANGPIDSVSTGTLINTNDSVSVATAGYPGVGVSISGGTAANSIEFLASTDGGATYQTRYVVNKQNLNIVSSASGTGSNGQFMFVNLAGEDHIQIFCLVCISQNITVRFTKTTAISPPMISDVLLGTAIPVIGNFIAGNLIDTGTSEYLPLRNTVPASSDAGVVVRQVPNTVATPLYVRESDGTNALGTVTNPFYVNLAGNQSTPVNISGSINDMGLVSQYAPISQPGKYQPLSLNILGELRVVCGNDCVVDGPPIYKGTQKNTGFQVQEFKDSGRTYVTLYAQAVATVTSEALITFTKNVAGTTTASQTAYTITNGKTFRIQSITVVVFNTTTVANNMIANVRVAPSVSASSPIVWTCATSAPAALATSVGNNTCPIADGIDIQGNGAIQIGISQLENVTTATASVTLAGYEY